MTEDNGELVGHKLIEVVCKYAKTGEAVDVGKKHFDSAIPVLKRMIEDENQIGKW